MEYEQKLKNELKTKLKKALFTTAEIKQIGDHKVFIVSDDVVDRQGESISTDGWELANYKKYPVLLWAHNPEMPLIGHGTNLRYRTINGKKKLTFEPKFHRKSDLSRLISDLVEDDWVRGVSVGFLPKEQDENKFLKQELLEISFVNVPANPNALNMAYAKGYDKKTVKKVLTGEKKQFKYYKCKSCGYSRKIKQGETTSKKCPSCGKKLIRSNKDFEIFNQKPYPSEHACRLRDPNDFQQGSFRSMTRSHEGKEYRVIVGKLEGKNTMSEQAYRYPKKVWEASTAKSHCSSHNGKFEEASKSIKELEGEFKKGIKKMTKKKKVKKKVHQKKKIGIKGIEEKIDKLVTAIEKRDEIIEANNKKTSDEFAKLKIDLDVVSKGIKPDKGLEQRFKDIEENIEKLAEGLRAFASSSPVKERSNGAVVKKVSKKELERRLIMKALNRTVELLNKAEHEKK